jgi:hypothetical protein
MSDLGHARAKVLSCKLLVPEDQVCFQGVHVEFVVDKGERTGTVSLQVFQFLKVVVDNGPFATAVLHGHGITLPQE